MARVNLEIVVGTYIGNGTDNTNITTGIRPNLVIVKSGSNNSIFKTRQMGINSASFSSNVVHFVNSIKHLTPTGFQVGTDATVNTNAATYYYIAIRGVDAQQYFRTAQYAGTGGDDRNMTTTNLFFRPDIMFTKGNTTQHLSAKIAAIAAGNSCHVAALGNSADELQSFITNGFQLGTSARVNGNAVLYDMFGLKHYAGHIASGIYTGNGTSQSVTGVGFQPDAIIIMDGGARAGFIKTADMSSTTSFQLNANGSQTTAITSLDSDGFSVGAFANVNTNAATYHYVALKEGAFSVPLTRIAV